MASPDPEQYKRPESVLVVVHSGDQVLLLKRVDHPDFWQSVTGALRWGEKAADAAARELAEETGFAARGLTDWARSFRFEILPHWRPRYAPEVRYNREYLFSLTLPACVQPRLNPVEHSTCLWLPREAALARVWSWSNRAGIELTVPRTG